jgi:hypothetical protein
LDALPDHPPLKLKLKWFRAAGCAYHPRFGSSLIPFCSSGMPATKEILPKLLLLMQCYHESKQKFTRWYYILQTSIVCSYKTEGTCVFYDDAKEILNGEKDFIK